MSAHQDGSQASYWPAFVDALTNVVINLLFLMGVMALAFFVVSLQAEVTRANKAVSVAQKQPRPTSAPSPVRPPAPAVEPVHALTVPISAQWAPFKTWTVLASQGEQGGPVVVQVIKPHAQGSGMRGQLVFDPKSLTPSLPVELLAPWLLTQKAGELRWHLGAVFEAGNPNSRRSAYMRLMAVRNTLLALGVGAAAIALDLKDTGRAGLDDRKVDVWTEPVLVNKDEKE